MNENIEYTQVVLSKLTKKDINRAVSHQQRTDMEYGIITSYDDKAVYVHFNNGENSIMIVQIEHLFFAKVKG